ncbi:MAG: phospho-N-acetylmuramoyl-pentapeptide-transferase [Chlamydiota bacterium]|nr:phospho-N-acetylmuramoyl-pentapeptide-transferase [Chlamydiota bacterium]
MLYHLFYPLKDFFFGFNVFRYITFRAGCAAVTALLISILLGPMIIRLLYSFKIGQPIRKEECPPLFALHRSKEGTPTMGGLLIIFSVTLSVLLWSDLTNLFIWIALFTFICLGFLGVADDALKIKHGKSKGVSAKVKLLVQGILSIFVMLFMYYHPALKEIADHVGVPFIKDFYISFGLVYIVVIFFVFVGTSNAVNLTDGLDGLAIGSVSIAAMGFSMLSYIVGNYKFANYLQVQYIPGAGELTVFCTAIVGSGLGFLWYNAYPAQVFMGDTGSLALGGALGAVALLIKQEIMLLMIGGLFVMEAMSVILQVGSFKTRRKRIFLMAPLHHHFEMKGWPETKITIRFWILAIIFALFSLGTLKLR